MLDLEVQKLIVDGKLKCWIDIDLNDTRAAYQRAVDFVGAKNLAYNLSSNWLPELGGSEQKRLKEQLYPNDFEWSQKGRCAVRLPPSRITVEVWPETAPLAVENFVALLLGNRGTGQESGCALSYKGCHFHRVMKGFVAQGGDFVKNNGSGGESVFGKKFKDDLAGLKVRARRESTSRDPLLAVRAARSRVRIVGMLRLSSHAYYSNDLIMAGEARRARTRCDGQLREEFKHLAVLHHTERRLEAHGQARRLRQDCARASSHSTQRMALRMLPSASARDA